MTILRPVSVSDAADLAAFAERAFVAAFGHVYDPADLRRFLDEAYSPAIVTAEIADRSITHRIAADRSDGPIAGFAKLRAPSPYASYSDATNPVLLDQLYVEPGRTSSGIGAKLMGWSLEQAQASGRDAMQLSVWSENIRAQAFYRRHGFAKIADIDFWVGAHRDDEFLFERRL